LIVVGDVDPAEIEAKIKAKFTAWKARAHPRAPPSYQAPATHSAPVKSFAEPGAPTYIIFDWLTPYDASPDNKKKEPRDVLRFIGLGVPNQGLAKLAHGDSPPFTSASAGHNHVDHVADTTTLFVTYRSGQGSDGLKAAERAWREAVQNGVRQDE